MSKNILHASASLTDLVQPVGILSRQQSHTLYKTHLQAVQDTPTVTRTVQDIQTTVACEH
jgi:hypothetical protein